MKVISTLALIFIVLIGSASAQATKAKPKKPANAAHVNKTPVIDSNAHAYFMTDGEFDEVTGAANMGFDKWILTTAIPANQIPNERQYFAGILINLLKTQKEYQKAKADSLAKIKAIPPAKVDTAKKQ